MADAAVAERIEAIWERSRRTHGAPRIHAMLAPEGIRVGHKRVARLMRTLGIQGAHLHKHWKTTRQDKEATAAPDLVERNFTASEPNRLWVAADTVQLSTGDARDGSSHQHRPSSAQIP